MPGAARSRPEPPGQPAHRPSRPFPPAAARWHSVADPHAAGKPRSERCPRPVARRPITRSARPCHARRVQTDPTASGDGASPEVLALAKVVARLRTEVADLEGLASGAAVLERAKGVLMAREGVSADEAYELLVEHAGRRLQNPDGGVLDHPRRDPVPDRRTASAARGPRHDEHRCGPGPPPVRLQVGPLPHQRPRCQPARVCSWQAWPPRWRTPAARAMPRRSCTGRCAFPSAWTA